MADVVARQLGQTLMILWTTPKGLGRKITAQMNQFGAQYHREVAPGDWRYEQIRGTSNIQFVEIGQLKLLVRIMLARG